MFQEHFTLIAEESWDSFNSLWKNAYSNILKILPPKKWKFSDKKSDIIHTSTQNIDCGYSLEPPRRGGSNEYPQSMFLRRNQKTNVYPCKPQFYYIKMGFEGVKIIYFRDVTFCFILIGFVYSALSFALVVSSGRLSFMIVAFPGILLTKTRLFKYIKNFTIKKRKLSDEKFGSFHISAQNIDCGYSARRF